MDKNNQNENRLQVELTPEVAAGTYSNLAIISHTPQEFIIDFVAALPGAPKARVGSRVVMTPENARRLVAALQENIAKYDEKRNAAAPKTDGFTVSPFGMGKA